MAGCLPEYMPVLIAAVAAMCEKPVDMMGMQPTTHPVAPLMIVTDQSPKNWISTANPGLSDRVAQ